MQSLLFQAFVALFLLDVPCILDRHLGELEGSQCFCQDRPRTEIDSSLLDECVLIFVFGESTLAAESYLKGAEVF